MAKTYLTRGRPRESADTLRPAPSAWDLTHPAGSAELHLYNAATEALSNAGVSGALAMAATPVSALVSRMRPLLRDGGRGLLAARAGANDGLYVGRDAVRRLGRPEDLRSLAKFDAAVEAKPWAEMTRPEKLALVRDTGFQQTPTGETVRQIPKLEYAKDAWRDYEPFVGRWRSAVADAAWRRFPETEARFADRVAGPGAEELFAYYPELADAKVSSVLSGPYVAAADDGTVYLTKEAFREGVKPLTATMHHEPQHLVQRASGMAPGSSPERAGLGYLGNRGGVAEGHFDSARFAEAGNFRKMDLAIANSLGSNDPALFRYRHAGGEAGAYAVGRTATEGPVELLEDAMRAEGINPELVYDNRLADAVASAGDREIMERQLTKMDLAETRQDNGGGKTVEWDDKHRNTRQWKSFVSQYGSDIVEEPSMGTIGREVVYPSATEENYRKTGDVASAWQWGTQVSDVFPTTNGTFKVAPLLYEGTTHTYEDARDHMEKTGQNFGTYRTKEAAERAAVVLHEIGAEGDQARANVVREAFAKRWSKMPFNPEGDEKYFDDRQVDAFRNWMKAGNKLNSGYKLETQQASKGGDDRFKNSRNFLATDKVPDTIFGIPVAKAEGEWTEEDLKFFKEHPEAGGYYSMGDEEQGAQGDIIGGNAADNVAMEDLKKRHDEWVAGGRKHDATWEALKNDAWALRKKTDMQLAGQIAAKHGGKAEDYYVPTTIEDIKLAEDKAAFAFRKNMESEGPVKTFSNKLAKVSDPGLTSANLRYLGARYGVPVKDELVPMNNKDFGYPEIKYNPESWNRETGWMMTGDPNRRIRFIKGQVSQQQLPDARVARTLTNNVDDMIANPQKYSRDLIRIDGLLRSNRNYTLNELAGVLAEGQEIDQEKEADFYRRMPDTVKYFRRYVQNGHVKMQPESVDQARYEQAIKNGVLDRISEWRDERRKPKVEDTVVDRSEPLFPANLTTGTRSFLSKRMGISPTRLVTEDDFNADQQDMLYELLQRTGWKTIGDYGPYNDILRERTRDPKVSFNSYARNAGLGVFTDPLLVVGTTIGRGTVTNDKDGLPEYLVDNFDFNVGDYGSDAVNRRAVSDAVEDAKQGKFGYSILRAIGPHVLHTSKDPDEDKVHIKVNLKNLRKYVEDRRKRRGIK